MTTRARTLTVHVPLAIRRQGGRKIIITPEHDRVSSPAPIRTQADPTLLKALARAHRWKHLLESGRYASISEMAAAEKIDRGYLGRILLLTLLAPDIVEAILDGTLSAGLGLPRLIESFPAEWDEQRAVFVGRAEIDRLL